MPTATDGSLQDLIDANASIVDVLYANRKGSVVRDAVQRQPTEFVLPEFTNWRDEQRAWREDVALYDQSYHMTTSVVRGPDALDFFTAMGVNGFATFTPNKARHFVCCSPSGHVIGDGILYWSDPEEIALVGRASGHNWLQFQAEQGSWNISVHRDEIFSANPDGRRAVYRYQVEGPHAFALLGKLNGTALPDTRTFDLIPITIAGHRVLALRHTMAGGPGYEIFGPWDEGPEVKAAIVTAGVEFGLRQVGSMAYFTTAVELGWIPRPMPAVFSGEGTREFREWAPATCEEATWSLGGSHYRKDIADYYFTPAELGYAHLVKFNHDFVGREALEAMAGGDQRRKVTIALDERDIAAVVESYADRDRLPGKYIDLPRATYSTWQYDTVMNEAGDPIGVSNYPCFSWNERAMLTLGVVESGYAAPGTRVSMLWGEPEQGSLSAPWLEPHRQMEIRGTVVDVGTSH
ncbi:MAG: hypothetical protein VW239_03655 [Candidatus Nanopelagicales bacterium]